MIKTSNVNLIYVYAQTGIYIVQNLQLLLISEDKSQVMPYRNMAHSADLQNHRVLIPPYSSS